MSAAANYAQEIRNKLGGLGTTDGMVAAPPAPQVMASSGPYQPAPYQPAQYRPAGFGQQIGAVAPPDQAFQPMPEPEPGMPSTMIGSYFVAGAAGVLTLSLIVVLFARRK